MASLDDFVTAKHQNAGKHPKCTTCNLPTEILSQAEEGRKEGYTYKIIHDWLLTQGVDIPTTTLTNHFKDEHHLGK